jgi:hypothetical protein
MYVIVQNVLYAAAVDRCRCPVRPGPRVGVPTPGFNGRYEVKTPSFRALAHRALALSGDGTGRSFLRHRRFDSEHQAIFIAGYDITEQESRDIASLLRTCEGPKRADAAI